MTIEIIEVDRIIRSESAHGLCLTVEVQGIEIDLWSDQKLLILRKGAIYCDDDRMSTIADRFEPEKYYQMWYAPTLAIICFQLSRKVCDGKMAASDITVELINDMQREIARKLNKQS